MTTRDPPTDMIISMRAAIHIQYLTRNFRTFDNIQMTDDRDANLWNPTFGPVVVVVVDDVVPGDNGSGPNGLSGMMAVDDDNDMVGVDLLRDDEFFLTFVSSIFIRSDLLLVLFLSLEL